MKNLNGIVILDALHTLEEPATLKSIVSVVATACGATPEDIHETVKSTLKGGVEHGFVQYANRKYFTIDADETTVNSNAVPSKTKGDGEPEDASRRRRRRSTSRRRRPSGSRSRSRRRKPRN